MKMSEFAQECQLSHCFSSASCKRKCTLSYFGLSVFFLFCLTTYCRHSFQLAISSICKCMEAEIPASPPTDENVQVLRSLASYGLFFQTCKSNCTPRNMNNSHHPLAGRITQPVSVLPQWHSYK